MDILKRRGIVLHCSDSEFGSSIEIDRWHRERGWTNVGYHFVICNGQIDPNTYLEFMNGAIERGRRLEDMGAHAKGVNDYIGICLIGVNDFTDEQFESLADLIEELSKIYNTRAKDIIGHYDVSEKSCPNFYVDWFINKYLIEQNGYLCSK